MRRILLSGAGCMALAAAAAAQDSDPLDPILACRGVEDDSERLACFDEAAAALGGEVDSGDVVAVAREDVEAVEEEGFGLNLPSLPRLSFAFLGGGGSDNGAGSSEGVSEEAAMASADEADDTRVIERSNSGRVDRILMTIERTSTHGYNTTRFHMTNGQVWEQTDDLRVFVPRVRGGERNTAVIRRATMGGYFLEVNGEGRSIRVQRVR